MRLYNRIMEKHVINERNNYKSIFIYIPNFLDEYKRQSIVSELESYNDWKIGYNYNGDVITRKQKWYQIDNQSFCKDWKYKFDRWEPNPYTQNLLSLQSYIEFYINNIIKNENDATKPKYNSLLINYYEDGNNFITAHQDSVESFGEYPTIALLSFGDSRKIILERTIEGKLARDKKQIHLNKEFNLEDNSLFIMAGCSQKYYCHAIEKEENKQKRYSLSFREYINL